MVINQPKPEPMNKYKIFVYSFSVCSLANCSVSLLLAVKDFPGMLPMQVKLVQPLSDCRDMNILVEFLNLLARLIAIQALVVSKGLIKLFAIEVHVAIIQRGHETWDIRFQKFKQERFHLSIIFSHIIY